MQKYHFFLNRKSVTFIKKPHELERNIFNESIVIDIRKTPEIDYTQFFNENQQKNWIIICGDQLKETISAFKKKFKMIKAAGGLVETLDGSILFIFKNGVWDLPKGKIEKDEDAQNTAVREVKEECGIKDLLVEKKLRKTYHFYQYNGCYILKQTCWYKMKSEKKQELIPQMEEGITKAVWINKENLLAVFENTYPNIELLLHENS